MMQQLSWLHSSRKPAPWTKEIKVLEPSLFYRILVKVVDLIARSEDPDLWIEQLAQFLPLEKLEEILKTRCPELVSAQDTAKNLQEEARHFLQMVEPRPSSSWKIHAAAFFDLCISILETFLNAFGLADFFRSSESSLDNEIKSGKIMQLLGMFTTVSTLLVPILGAALATSIVGGTLLGTTNLSLIFPYIRPAPSQLPKGANWTKQYREGKLIAPLGRKQTLDEIASTMTSSQKVKTHPMVIGKSGAGKTETAKAFVQAIAQGEYPELSGKQVFYFNTADLVKGSEALTGENKILANIDRAMGHHRDKMILIFDEIHLACQKETGTIGEQLKTMLDPGNRRFPHVIGITTEEEYYRDIYLNNTAFARRFKRINIENPTPAETLEILTNMALETAPQVLIEEGSLQELMVKTREAFPSSPEPIASLKILSKCLQKTAESQKSPLAKQAEELRIQIRSLHAVGAAIQGAALLPYSRQNEISRLEGQLEQVEARLEEGEAMLAHFFRQRESLFASKKEAFRTVLNVSQLQPSSLTAKQKSSLTAFLLRTHFLTPAQSESLVREAQKLGIRTVLDSSLIDAVIEEELENDRKVQETVDRGKLQIQARNAISRNAI